VHRIEQVAEMLTDRDSDDDAVHGAAFTIKQTAERTYTLIDDAKARNRERRCGMGDVIDIARARAKRAQDD
jgi:hypothetical protein